MFKLNGGLGTSMGLEKAKSLLEVKDGKTFLDLIAEQVKFTRQKYGSKVSIPFGHNSQSITSMPAAEACSPACQAFCMKAWESQTSSNL